MFSRYLQAASRHRWSVRTGIVLGASLLVLSVPALHWQFTIPRLGIGLQQIDHAETGHAGTNHKGADHTGVERVGADQAGALVTSVYSEGSAAAAGVQPGDTLLSVGQISMPPKSTAPNRTAVFELDVLNQYREGERVDWTVVRDGKSQHLSGTLVGLPNSLIVSRAVVLGVFWVIACFLLWARPRRKAVRHLAFTIFALTASVLFLVNRRMAVDTPLGFLVQQAHDIGSFLAPAMVIHFGVIFPVCTLSDQGRRWALWATYGFYFLAVFLVSETLFFRAFFSPEAPYTLLPPALESIHYGVIGQWLHIANYLVCGFFMYLNWRGVQKRTLQNKVKWVLWAVLLTGGIDLLANAVVLYVDGLSGAVLYPYRNYLYLLIAVGLLISVFCHDLFNVDVVLRKSVIYFSTTVVLFAVFVGIQEVAEQVLSQALPLQSKETSTWGAAALSAVLFEPIRLQVQHRVSSVLPQAGEREGRT